MPPAAGIWKIRVYHTLSIQGEYHMWLPVHGFISDETFFLRPDPDTTITDPGNTAAIITTAAYSHQTGGIYLHSSRGFTRTRTIKPDLAAPGVRLPLPDYQEVTGTSFAAAMTAGAAAREKPTAANAMPSVRLKSIKSPYLLSEFPLFSCRPCRPCRHTRT